MTPAVVADGRSLIKAVVVAGGACRAGDGGDAAAAAVKQRSSALAEFAVVSHWSCVLVIIDELR